MEPPDVRGLFEPERDDLLRRLATLAAEDWEAPSPCPNWSLKDVVAHLVGDDLGAVSGGRDRHGRAWFSGEWDDLVSFINASNEEWVVALRRLSPRVLREMLEASGTAAFAFYRSLDPEGPGPTVDWAGPGPHAMALHLAREYTERWLHGEHIREAAGLTGIRTRELFFPVLDTFVHALPRALATTDAPEGTHIRFATTGGEANGAWSLVRDADSWGLYLDVESPPAAAIELDAEVAWRMFTKGVTPEQASAAARIEGDERLAFPAFDAVAILA